MLWLWLLSECRGFPFPPRSDPLWYASHAGVLTVSFVARGPVVVLVLIVALLPLILVMKRSRTPMHDPDEPCSPASGPLTHGGGLDRDS